MYYLRYFCDQFNSKFKLAVTPKEGIIHKYFKCISSHQNVHECKQKLFNLKFKIFRAKFKEKGV